MLSFDNQHFKSKTIKNEKNPTWEESTKLTLDENSPNQINVSVFDEDFGKDDCLGDANINLNETWKNFFPFIHTMLFSTWVMLQPSLGSLVAAPRAMFGICSLDE